jgi:hypothetical protein
LFSGPVSEIKEAVVVDIEFEQFAGRDCRAVATLYGREKALRFEAVEAVRNLGRRYRLLLRVVPVNEPREQTYPVSVHRVPGLGRLVHLLVAGDKTTATGSPTRRAADPERGVNYATAFDAMTRFVPDDAIVPVDVGNNTYAFGRHFEPEHQTVLMSGYLGSIGFSFPAALGVCRDTGDRHGLDRPSRGVGLQ